MIDLANVSVPSRDIEGLLEDLHSAMGRIDSEDMDSLRRVVDTLNSVHQSAGALASYLEYDLDTYEEEQQQLEEEEEGADGQYPYKYGY